MRVRPRFLPLCLVPFLVNACAAQAPEEPEAIAAAHQALGGIEGTFEYALDAPWRIEPVLDASGNPTYGAIPLQISIHDGNIAGADRGSFTSEGTFRTLGNFCELEVDQNAGGSLVRRHIGFDHLSEIETTTGPWRPDGLTPPHQVCKPSSASCAALQNVGPTSEWHAGAWFTPWGGVTPGMDLPLVLKAKITRDASISCSDTDPKKFYTLTNHVRVHYGEAPLPRFDNGWLYGDVHYHSQGTDNEGEAGYHYRGVMRAMGALGVDFAFATDHASSSEQIVDVDMDWGLGTINVSSTGGVLRDMNAARFKALHGELWKSGGVNADALVGAPGSTPQGYRSHGVVPRLFLGGEVDAIPETAKSWDGTGYVFGNGLYFDARKNLCGGWVDESITIDGSCDPLKTTYDAGDAFLFRDVQGIHDYGFSRAHLVTLPASSTNPNAFVASNTGKYGGGARRLTKSFNGQAALLPDIASKGYAFIAHPVPIGGCPTASKGPVEWNGASATSGLDGSEGPDGPPWTDSMISQALQSSGILGLELWNEDTRLCTSIGAGDAKEIGYESQSLYPKGELDDRMKRFERKGFATGEFELRPFYSQADGSYQNMSTGVEWMLHHGTALWDRVLRSGMNPAVTSSISWLPAGEPRRMFIAGGSDAHGDFNYRREGYMTGTSTITDTAIAKVRNLVGVGAPLPPPTSPVVTTGDLVATLGTDPGPAPTTSPIKGRFDAATVSGVFVDGSLPPPPQPHSQEQIVGTLKDGNFSVTDGPALRIAIDKNRNGVIDAGDTPMGGIVELYGEDTLPVLVEWKSTAEFGNVADVQLYVGVQAGTVDRTYAVSGHGPQSVGIASSTVYSSYTSAGRTYGLMKDGYWVDPTGLLHFVVPSWLGQGGVQKIDLPIAAFEASYGRRPERMYVRAFAQTAQKDAAACATSVGQKTGACIRRYAFTNPIWTIDGPREGGVCPTDRPRAMDRDGDGYPDGCDVCPTTSRPICIATTGGLGGKLVAKGD